MSNRRKERGGSVTSADTQITQLLLAASKTSDSPAGGFNPWILGCAGCSSTSPAWEHFGVSGAPFSLRLFLSPGLGELIMEAQELGREICPGRCSAQRSRSPCLSPAPALPPPDQEC